VEQNTFVAGSFKGFPDFDPGAAIDIHTSYPAGLDAPSWDPFITKLNGDGSYAWTRTFGGPGFDTGDSVGADADGNVFFAGTFRGYVDFDPGEGEERHPQYDGYNDCFITPLGPDGSYRWTRTLPPDFLSHGPPLAVDHHGNVIVAGTFTVFVDFDPTPDIDFRIAKTPYSLFVTKLYGDGSYAWTQTFDTTINGSPSDVSVDADDNIILAGTWSGTVDFDPGPGVKEFTSPNVPGVVDAFILQLSAGGDYQWVRVLTGLNNNHADRVATGSDGDVFVLGRADWAADPTDIDPGCGVENIYTSVTGEGTFIMRLTCIEPTSDFTSDGLVDLRDLAAFQNCFTADPPSACPSGCEVLDFDHDDDIDLSDFYALQRVFAGL